MVGHPALAAGAGLGLELVDEVDDVEEAAAGAAADAGPRAMPTAMWVLPVPVPPIRATLRCWSRKPPPARSRTRVSLIGCVEDELVDLLAIGSLGDGDLVLDRAGLLLGELSAVRRSPPPAGARAAASPPRRRSRRRPHAEELQVAHRRHDLASLHHPLALLRLSYGRNRRSARAAAAAPRGS